MRFLKALRGYAIGALLAALTIAPALAQTIAPSATVTAVPGNRATYSANIVGFAPAASATDFFSITGSATKTVRVVEAGCDGTSTAASNHVLQGVIRSTADTGGTPTTVNAVEHDTINPTATAVVVSYAANPTLGTATAPFGVLRANELYQAVVTTGAYTPGTNFVSLLPFTSNQGITLRGVAQMFALNGNAASFAAGTLLNCRITWTEG